jgi:hypothetical protein
MSDPFPGARSPDVDPRPGTDTYPTPARADAGDDSAVKRAAGQGAQAASEVRDTAAEQARRVGAEARTQARSVASDVRDQVGRQARTQNDKLVGGIRQMADHLDEMRGDRRDSPAAQVVDRVAEGGRQLADYLDSHGPEGVLREVQDFARRRPGAFLATALAAGFVVGRLGKGVLKADEAPGKPDTDTFVSTGAEQYTGGGYPAGEYPATDSASTEYAATGTGVPVPVEEERPGGPR